MVTIEQLRYGVELECGGQTRETVAHAVQSVVGGTIRHIGGAPYDAWCVTAPDGREWRVVADSSLSAYEPDKRTEVVTPILTWDDLPTVQEIVRALRRAKCSVNGQAGLHVHVGSELFTGKTLAILAKQVYANEELIFHAFAVSEERKARYTKPLDPTFITRLERRRPATRGAFFQCWYNAKQYQPTRYHASRYTLINFNSTALRDTIEFRSYTPEGLHAGKIKAAIVFSLALCARALNSKAASAKKKAYDPASAKYDFRVALILALNLSGPEHKHTRRHLLERMPGDAAFKYKERRPQRAAVKKTEETTGAGAETLQPSC
ncbi:MAG: putative amidoligase enzyme [bacterium ADurb.Bin429]|nr:MAG: putative amidoligase enzyme [bacterium ADurb.Bin429]